MTGIGREPQYEAVADEFRDHATDGFLNAHVDRPACLGLLGAVAGKRVLDASADLALCALAIEYVDDRARALSELRRVLTPSGALVLSKLHPTADWLRHGGDYFGTRIVEEVWTGVPGEWHMRFWIAPLEQTMAEIADAGFLVERLVEPRPVPTARALDPERYARYSTQPGFLALRLVAREDRVGSTARGAQPTVRTTRRRTPRGRRG